MMGCIAEVALMSEDDYAEVTYPRRHDTRKF